MAENEENRARGEPGGGYQRAEGERVRHRTVARQISPTEPISAASRRVRAMKNHGTRSHSVEGRSRVVSSANACKPATGDTGRAKKQYISARFGRCIARHWLHRRTRRCSAVRGNPRAPNISPTPSTERLLTCVLTLTLQFTPFPGFHPVLRVLSCNYCL